MAFPPEGRMGYARKQSFITGGSLAVGFI